MLLFKELRLFVLAFNSSTVNVPNDPINNTNNRVLRDSHTKHFLPRVNVTNYNVLIDARNFYNQPINDLIKQYDEIRKIEAGTWRWLYNRMFVRLTVL